jgi:hypothetical protein
LDLELLTSFSALGEAKDLALQDNQQGTRTPGGCRETPNVGGSIEGTGAGEKTCSKAYACRVSIWDCFYYMLQ